MYEDAGDRERVSSGIVLKRGRIWSDVVCGVTVGSCLQINCILSNN